MTLARQVLEKIVSSGTTEKPANFTIEETEFIAYAVVNHTGLAAVA